jgi:hypothetical protein
VRPPVFYNRSTGEKKQKLTVNSSYMVAFKSLAQIKSVKLPAVFGQRNCKSLGPGTTEKIIPELAALVIFD